MQLLLSNASDTPIYEQMKEQIKEQLFCGGLSAGEKLPSIRTMARELQVSFITVTRVYEELAQEGILENQQGKGCFVRPLGGGVLHTLAREEVKRRLSAVADFARTRAVSLEELEGLLRELKEEKDES